MQDKEYIIYLHRNKINGKCYVGQTSQRLIDRTGTKGQNYYGCPIFYRAIIKYGWDSFEHIILETGLSKDQVDEREVYWGQYYNSLAPNGYNVELGNNGHHIEADCHRLTRSEASQKLWESQELRELISQKSKQMWKEATEECKQKMLNNLDRTGKGAKARQKKILCIETNIIYESLREAERQTGISHSGISMVCNKKMQTAGGYHWKFVEEGEL